MSTQTVRSNDADIVVHTTGEGRDVLLVHGFTGSSIDFVDVAPSLAEAGFRVSRIDHRGHGESTNTGNAATYTFDQMADDLDAVLAALGLDSVHLFGHSMGGVVAQRFVLSRPDKVQSLVLMDTAAEAMTLIAKEMAEGVMAVGIASGMSAVYDMMAPFLTAPDPNKTPEHAALWQGRAKAKILQMDPVAFGTLGSALGEYESMLPGLAQLSKPAMVICGEDDVGLIGASEKMAETIPGVRYEVVERAGHCPNEDRPDEWVRLMHSFLEGTR